MQYGRNESDNSGMAYKACYGCAMDGRPTTCEITTKPGRDIDVGAP